LIMRFRFSSFSDSGGDGRRIDHSGASSIQMPSLSCKGMSAK
jgi:hypothetical protein